MSPVNITVSRHECFFLAKVADQAERYRDVIAQIKSLITFSDASLTLDERNLLSVAYKNITANLRGSWRIVDTLQKREEARTPTWQHLLLMRREKENIERDLEEVCKDVVELLERFLIPAADPGEEKVFYCKMRGDYYRYLAEISRDPQHEQHAATSLDAYKFAYKHALTTLDAVHPTRLGLALNFAVYYHDIAESPERACYLAKHAFDEAVAAAASPSFGGQSLEDALMILQLLKDDLILWSEEVGPIRIVSDV